jgi:peptide/nickel transport system substrate-binding protein
VFAEETPTAYTFERNPYYYKVDTAGNQLPYIDRHIQIKITDPQVRLLKILNGELDFAAWGTTIENYPTMKKNEDAGGYNAWVAQDLWGAAAVYCVNQTYQGDDADIMNPLLQDVKFRQALSLAMDRMEINNLIALDQGVPRQATVHPDTPGFKQEWAETYAEYDTDRANALLDEIGLTQRDEDGFRMTAEGEPITLLLPIRGKNQIRVSITELVKGYFQDVGIRTNVKVVGGNLSNIQKSSTFHIFTWALDRVHGPAFIIARGSWLNPNFWFGPIGPLWKTWLSSDGESGVEPPAVVKDLHYRAEEMPFVSPEEQEEIIQFIGDAYAENLWMIGSVGMIGKPVISKKELGNVRREAYPDNISTGGVRNQWMEQFYWTTEERRSGM